MKPKEKVVVIGSGIGGLVSALILAKHDYEVTVLEKNHQIGGMLQVFSRDKTIFDTGVHYVGGLDKGENLARIFSYLGIYDELKMKRLNEDSFDVIRLANGTTINHGMGYTNFREQLSSVFPDQTREIDLIIKSIQEYCTYFPLYNLELDSEINYIEHNELLELGAWQHLESITSDTDLIQAILGSGPLYAGMKDYTPFYVVALILNSFIKGSYRFVNGGSQIAKLLMKQIGAQGGEVKRRKEVNGATFDESGKIKSILCEDGSEYPCDYVISNLHPAITIDIIGKNRFKPAYVKRILNNKNTIASFMVYITFHEETVPYYNSNFYDYFTSDLWKEEFEQNDGWPHMTFTSFQVSQNTTHFAESASVMCYMDFSVFEEWKDSTRTIVKDNERAKEYEALKKIYEQKALDRIEERFPGIKQHIKTVYSSTPITYRDYISTPEGSMYGIQKNFNHLMKTQINSKTHIPNLFLTGQNIIFHGILGATIGALVTTFNFVKNDQLLAKIKSYD